MIKKESSSTILSFDDYMQQVLSQHPVAKQAALWQERANAEMLFAKGQFDPQLGIDWQGKQFDTKNYYDLFEAGFRIPTRFGPAIIGGYEANGGEYLNPENTDPERGLWTLGVEANLLQGLLIDAQRATLEQANLFQELAENERQIQFNSLIAEAVSAYVGWQAAYLKDQTLANSIILANTYFEATKQTYLQGDKAAVDTLEAYLIVQDRMMRQQDIRYILAERRRYVEQFLWLNGIPLELAPGSVPMPDFTRSIIGEDTLPVLDDQDLDLAAILDAHPLLISKQLKRDRYTIDQRLKMDKLKPKLKVKYQPLFATSEQNLLPSQYAFSNFKWGVTFDIPIPMRQSRAEIQRTAIKIKQVNLELTDKQNELSTKMKANVDKQRILENQIQQQENNIKAYDQLLEAERQKFQFGESSVFLLNKREEKSLSAKVKMIDLQAKQQLLEWQLLFLTGTSHRLFDINEN